jgi:hypothetical protein
VLADDEVQCFASDPIFPSFDMSCQSDSDCAVGVHQVNCCGTRRALGINTSEVSRFAMDEAVCRGQYPACDCADFGIEADDGQRTYEEDNVGVACARSGCRTFVIAE